MPNTRGGTTLAKPSRFINVEPKMKRQRTSTPTFNPDKFLADEKKKSERAMSPHILFGIFLPLTFSKERRRAFIAKLTVESPAVFHPSQDPVEIQAAVATLKEMIAKELVEIGVAADHTLIGYLVADVIRDPAWRRAKRRK